MAAVEADGERHSRRAACCNCMFGRGAGERDLLLDTYFFGRLSIPPLPISSALIQNMATNPNAEAIEPKAMGATRRVRCSTDMRNPIVSPERPSADLLNISIEIIGCPHPIPRPKPNEIKPSIAALLKNGIMARPAAPTKNAPASTLSSLNPAIRRGSITRTTNIAAELTASTIPMVEADRPIEWAYTGM